MFPQINSIFRKKETAQIASLKIENNSPILIDSKIDLNLLEKKTNNIVIIDNLQDKLDILGAHFAGISNKQIENNRPKLNKLINKEVTTLKTQIKTERKNNTTISFFSNRNTADNPSPSNEYITYFTNTYELSKKFKKLNNKKSYGLDKIPNIVLKNTWKTNLQLHDNFQ